MSPRYEEVADVPQLPTKRATRPTAVPSPAPAAASSAGTDRNLVTITVAIPHETRRRLRIRCAEDGIKLQDAVDDAIRVWLDQGTKET